MRFRNVLALSFSCLVIAACADHDSGGPAAPLQQSLPAFETRIVVPTGAGAHADAAVADFDGNGSQDVVVVSLSGQIQLMSGNANGTFTPLPLMNVGGSPIAIRPADVDGDRDQDIVVVRTAADETNVYLNDGRGNFTPGAVLPVGAEAVFLVCADVDGDGLDDIVVSRVVSPELHVFTADGQGGFTAASKLVMPGGGSPISMTVGDATADGLADLTVCDQTGDRVLVYHGQVDSGSGPLSTTPEEIPVPGRPGAVSLGDLSGDGIADLAISQIDAGQLFVITDRSGVTQQGFSVPVESGRPSLSTIRDLTGDGLLDLVACVQGRHSISLFVGQPGGGLAREQRFDATGRPLRPRVADFDADGRDDLMIACAPGDRLNLYLGRDGGLRGSQSHDVDLVSPEAVAGADFDGDGEAEVVAAGRKDTIVSVSHREIDPLTGDEVLVPVFKVDLMRPIHNVETADGDGDGLADVYCAVDGGVKILRNRSAGGQIDFDVLPPDPNQLLAAGATGPYSMGVADMNGDELLDLVVADFEGGAVHVQRAVGASFQFEAQPFTLPLGGNPAGLAVADFDGDGRPDVAVSRHDLAQVSVLGNLGQGDLANTVDLPVGAGPNFLRTSDFNNDGRADLVVSNGSGSEITVIHSRPQGFASREYPAGRAPTALLARDLNGDGFSDILVAAARSAEFRVLLGDGSGGFPVIAPYPGTATVSSADLADIDGDGDDDLLLAGLLAARVSVVRNITPR